MATSGNYNITVPHQTLANNVFPFSHSASFTGSNSIDSINNFAISLIPDTSLNIYGSIGAARPGFDCIHNFHIHSEGEDSVNSTIKVVIDPQIQYNYATPTPDAINGNTLEWYNIPITFNAYKQFTVYTTIPSTLPLGTIIIDSSYVYPINNDYNPFDNIYIVQRVVSNSYDPNEKTVEPLNGLTSMSPVILIRVTALRCRMLRKKIFAELMIILFKII